MNNKKTAKSSKEKLEQQKAAQSSKAKATSTKGTAENRMGQIERELRKTGMNRPKGNCGDKDKQKRKTKNSEL